MSQGAVVGEGIEFNGRYLLLYFTSFFPEIFNFYISYKK